LYLYAMKAPITRDKYQRSLAKFLEFAGLEGATTVDKARLFAQRGKSDGNWAFEKIIKFIQFQKDRVDRREITSATVRNYLKSIKLFCEMADIGIPWKKISRGFPVGRTTIGYLLIKK